MQKDKELQLKNKLSIIIKEIGRMQDVIQVVMDEFKSRNLNSLRASLAFKENLDLNTLTNSDEDVRFLFLFTFSLSKALKEKNIDINLKVLDYFTQTEYAQWEGYKEEKEEEDFLPYTISHAQKLTDKIWQTVMSAQEMNKLSKSNYLLYNFRTQRNPKINAYGEIINLEMKKVKEIEEKMLSGEQFPDPIIINILNNGESSIVYNETKETLTINKGSILNIVDGFHRKTALELSIEKNPDLQFNCQVTITFLSEKGAHDYMSQKNKQKPMKKEWIQQKDYSKAENLVIDVILDDKLSELAKVMKDDDAYINLNKALTKKSIIAEAVKECYEEQLKISTNIRNIGKWIVEFTDYLMGVYTEEFIVNPYNVKETSMINHKNIFYGYIALSAKLQDNKQWKELLKQKMESIDFNKDNQLWKDFGVLNNREINKTSRVKLYKLFMEEV